MYNTDIPQVFNHTPTEPEVIEKILGELSNYLDEKRLNHTFFVEKEAQSIAESVFLVYNIKDIYINDLKAAALLHDLTKKFSLEKQLELCEKYNIFPGNFPSCALLHGKTAAFLARELFGINDIVFSAVYNHTTGKENMNIFDKIIFLADYIEPSRKYEHCKQTRSFFYSLLSSNGVSAAAKALDEAVVMSMDGTIKNLVEQGMTIDLQTVTARNYLIHEMSDFAKCH